MPVVTDAATYSATDVLAVDLSQIRWRATGCWLGDGADSRCQLGAVVQIGGADLHLSAIEVSEADGVQRGATGAEDDFDRLNEFDGRDGKFETVSIEGRRYVLIATAFRRVE